MENVYPKKSGCGAQPMNDMPEYTQPEMQPEMPNPGMYPYNQPNPYVSPYGPNSGMSPYTQPNEGVSPYMDSNVGVSPVEDMYPEMMPMQPMQMCCPCIAIPMCCHPMQAMQPMPGMQPMQAMQPMPGMQPMQSTY